MEISGFNSRCIEERLMYERPSMIHWSKVSESDMKTLAESMFDAAGVPKNVRDEYWKHFNNYKDGLTEK